jgi:hypothetical protein
MSSLHAKIAPPGMESAVFGRSIRSLILLRPVNQPDSSHDCHILPSLSIHSRNCQF